MKKKIGITTNIRNEKLLTTGLDNIDSIVNAGGLPVVLPNLVTKNDVSELLAGVDGILVTGGGDIDPTYFGEEPHRELGEVCPDRDTFEMMLVKEALLLDKPILAICRGCQVLNIAAGGDIYQDIYSQIDKELLQHYQQAPRTHASHYIHLKEDTIYKDLINEESIKVNSFHHQSVRKLGKGFVVSAVATDGTIEAFESQSHKFVIAVQWHPENLFRNNDIHSKKLFEAFINAC